jgi:hypothetical protein
LEALAATPGFWNDQNKARAVIDETNRHKAVMGPYPKVDRAIQDCEVLIELARHEADEAQRNHAL